MKKFAQLVNNNRGTPNNRTYKVIKFLNTFVALVVTIMLYISIPICIVYGMYYLLAQFSLYRVIAVGVLVTAFSYLQKGGV